MNRSVRSGLGIALVVGTLAFTSMPLAQVSASFDLREHTFNAGGHPADGMIMSSTSFRITLDSIGDAIAGQGLSSPSYGIDGGFVPIYPPPLEVQGLVFTDFQTLEWIPTETATAGYNIYRGLLSSLSGLAYGSCSQQNVSQATTTDGTPALANTGFFFLVTAENTLNEDGSKGENSAGTRRLGTVCP